MNGPIAFATEGAHSQIYTVNADGTGLRQLTHVTAGVQVDMPDWSPDGRQILYVSNVSGQFDVWEMQADGTSQHLLAHAATGDLFEPRWSPDGTRIAVQRCDSRVVPDLYCDIDVMRSDGTGRHIVVGGHVTNGDPSWSPDGAQLAFTSNRAGLVSAVWKVDLESGGLTRLTTPALEFFFPSWSPLGGRLLASSNFDRPLGSHVYVMNDTGGRARRVSPEPPNKTSMLASYSPDGRRVVLISNVAVGIGADLDVMDANGRDFTSIVTGHRHLFFSDWGPVAKGPTR